MEDKLISKFFAFFTPVFVHTNKAGVANDVILLRSELTAPTPDGFSDTLAKWQRGGVFDYYALFGLVVTERVMEIHDYDLLKYGTIKVGDLNLACVFIAGPVYEAFLRETQAKSANAIWN